MNHKEILHWLRRHIFLAIIVSLFVCNLVLGTMLYFPNQNVLRVSFLSVGQGDAVLIEAPNGNQLLYDAGPPSGASLRALAREMSFFDRTIDVAVLSHPDMDHIGGFPEIFKRYDVSVAVVSGATSDNGAYEASEKAIVMEEAGHLIAKQGMQINLGGGVTLDILYPVQDASQMETNSASIVMLLQYGSTTFLFSGDLPKNLERYLARTYGTQLHANVLKLGYPNT